MEENWFDRLVGSVLKTVGMVLQRALWHFISLVAAFWFWDGLYGFDFFDVLSLKLAVYTGLICLVPCGSVKNPYWFVPVLAGCVQGAVLVPLGIPFPLVLFWAGLQTWVLRLWAAKGAIGWDWTAAPLLVLGLAAVVSQAPWLRTPLLPLASFPVISLVGLALYRTYLKVCHKSVHTQIVASLLVRMRKLVQGNRLAEAEARYTNLLLSQCEALATANGLGDEALVDRINALVGRLENHAATRKPLGALFKSAQWQHLSSTPQERQAARGLLEELQEVTTLLGKLLRAQSGSDSQERKLLDLAGQAQSLLDKVKLCPAQLAGPLENIAFTSLDMVARLRADQARTSDAADFLARYLPRVHHIADEIARMRGRDLPLARTREVLERLEKAFGDERSRMGREETINYAAEIDALDQLLKMRGY